MKNQVIEFLQDLPVKPEAQFNKALDLYRKSPLANANIVRRLNVAGYSPSLLDNLLYDLKQLHGITDAMVRNAKAAKQPKVIDYFPILKMPKWSKGTKGTAERKAFCKKYGLKPKGKRHVDYDTVIENYISNVNDDTKDAKEEYDAMIATLKESGVQVANPSPEEAKKMLEELNANSEDDFEITAKESSEVFPSAPEPVKTYVKLRDKYPFLSEDDCPDELKILVADKQTAYEKYVKAHNALLVVVPDDENQKPYKLTEAEILHLAQTAVENFELNQAIFAEMEHYQKTGKILGDHPIFIQRKLQDSINKMSMAEAAKRQSNLENYLRRDQKNLEKATTDSEKEKFQKKLVKWQAELDLIMAKLGAK